MSTSESSYDDEDNVPISKIFGSVSRPRLDTEHVNALQVSVRNQKLEREKINKGQESDQSEEESENDRIETTEKVANKEAKTDNLLKGDVTQEDDMIETTEYVSNKEDNDSYDSPAVKDNKKT